MSVKSLYIHYPYCKHLCHYCDFYKNIYTEKSNVDFLKKLKESFVVHKKFLKEHGESVGKLETVYVGGGTPSLLGKDFLLFLEVLYGEFDLSEVKEFSVEVDPGTVKLSVLEKFQKKGVNRFSLGLQSIDPFVQPFLDRSHSAKDALALLKAISKSGINFSVDFMLGLAIPSYLNRSIATELGEILKFEPNHISLYILSASRGYPFTRWLPSDDKVAEEYLLVDRVLSSYGFDHYEVSNYAKKNFQSKHNWKYWNQDSYCALGPSATGLIVQRDCGIRYKWSPSGENIKKEFLTIEQLRLEHFYTSLRTSRGLDVNLHPVDRKQLQVFEEQGYGELVEGYFHFLPKGWVILDSLVEKLL